MPNYRRNHVPGATYFFTVNLANRRSNLLVREITALREAVSTTRTRHPFHIDAWVVLPNHLHAIWTMPETDPNFFITMVVDQTPLLGTGRGPAPAIRITRQPRRAQRMAATLLGTHDTKRNRLRRPPGLRTQ